MANFSAPIEVAFVRRIDTAVVRAAADHFREKSRGVKALRPEHCPAIREFNSQGWIISTPITLNFEGPRRFRVEIFDDCDGELFLSPGVIGSPDSERLYARVDSGISIAESPIPLLAIQRQDNHSAFSGVEIPGTLYPAGYVGPILLPISSDRRVEILAGEALLHVIPQCATPVLTKVDDREVTHPSFEGLYVRNWTSSFTSKGHVWSDEYLAIA